MAQTLLKLHVRRNLIDCHMPRPLDHDLHARIPRTLGELADFDELTDLSSVGRIVIATWAHRIAEGNGHVMLVQDIEHLVVVLVERVLVARRLHPREDERPAARHHVHEPPRFLERFDGTAIHARMDCDEVDAVLSVAAHDVEEVLGGDGDEGLLEVPDSVVHGNGADHRR